MTVGSLYDSHGDVLVTKVRRLRFSRRTILCSRPHQQNLTTAVRAYALCSRAAQVHKPNSLEHLKADRYGKRPTSAASTRSNGGRSSTSAGSQRMRPVSAHPAMRPPSVRPSSVRSSMSRVSEKSAMKQMIEGDTGPQMIGVTTYPYTRLQYEYLDDFQSLVATTIDHPYMATAAFNRASVPHDILYGSNFDDDRLGPQKKWLSEYKLSYPVKDIVAAKRAASSGVRSEQFQFLG